MKSILSEIDKVRSKLKNAAVNALIDRKPFAQGMYSFSMFMISYYWRVRDKLKLDYDSFMIIQTVVSHNLYHLNKKQKTNVSYQDIEKNLDQKEDLFDKVVGVFEDKTNVQANTKLTMSSICLVTSLPKETVRRKTNELIKRNLLKNSKKQGILLGPMYKKVFQDFVPQTTLDVSKLVKDWEKKGVLRDLLNFKI